MSIKPEYRTEGARQMLTFRISGNEAVAGEAAIIDHLLYTLSRGPEHLSLIMSPIARRVVEEALLERRTRIGEYLSRVSGSGAPRTPEKDRP